MKGLENIPWEGEFTQRSDPWAGLIASCGSFYPMINSLSTLIFSLSSYVWILFSFCHLTHSIFLPYHHILILLLIHFQSLGRRNKKKKLIYQIWKETYNSIWKLCCQESRTLEPLDIFSWQLLLPSLPFNAILMLKLSFYSIGNLSFIIFRSLST